MIMYELHIGTFSEEGTFAGAKGKAQKLAKIGINAVELMPVSQFSGQETGATMRFFLLQCRTPMVDPMN